MAERAIAELGGVHHITVAGPMPDPFDPVHGLPAPTPSGLPMRSRPRWRPTSSGAAVATHKAYADALVALGARDSRVGALDGEVKNSTYTAEFARA